MPDGAEANGVNEAAAQLEKTNINEDKEQEAVILYLISPVLHSTILPFH